MILDIVGENVKVKMSSTMQSTYTLLYKIIAKNNKNSGQNGNFIAK